MLKLIFSLLGLIITSSVNQPKECPGEATLNRDNQNININKTMLKVVTKYNQNIRKTPYFARAYFLEKAKCRGSYCMYTDGVGYLYSAGYDCQVPIDNFSFLCENMRKSNRKACWLDLLENLYKKAPVKNQTDIPPGYNSLFSAFRWFEEKGPLSKEGADLYRFQISAGINKNGNKALLCIRFNPKSPSSPKVYYGALYIDKETFRIEYLELDKCAFYSNPFMKWTTSHVKVWYEYNNEQCFISALKAYYTEEGIKHWVELSTSLPITESFEIAEKGYSMLFDNDINPFVIYDESKWTKNNIPPDNDMVNIHKDLETERPMEEQFKFNSGKPYLITTLKFGEDDTDKREKGYKYIQEKIREFSKMGSN